MSPAATWEGAVLPPLQSALLTVGIGHGSSEHAEGTRVVSALLLLHAQLERYQGLRIRLEGALTSELVLYEAITAEYLHTLSVL